MKPNCSIILLSLLLALALSQRAFAQLTGADIGSVGVAGSNSVSGGVYTVSGSGTDIFDNADALHYVYQQMTGDGSIVAQVTSETNTSVFAKAGVMMRNSLTATDAEASALIHPAEPQEFDYRLTANAATGYSSAATTNAAPYWVKLTRTGNAFSGYASPDGSTWTLLGTETITMNSTIYVGLAVCAHNNSALCTSTFANVQISSGGGGSVPATPTGLTAAAGNSQVSLAWAASSGATSYNIYRGMTSNGESGTPVATGVTSPSYTDTGLTNGILYFYKVAAINSVGASGYSNEASATPAAGASLTGADVGSVGLAGSNSLSNGVYTISGSGTDIFDNADAFRYVYTQMTGDGSIVAQVTSQTNTNVFAKAGVMMRNSLNAADVEASTLIHPAEPEEFDYRLTSGASTGVAVTGTTNPAPYWVKLTRSGSSFTSYVSPDGSNWTTVGTEPITMNSTIYVGLAVSAHNNSALSTATFTNVQISSSGAGSTPPAPTGLAATAGAAQISLNWTASAGTASYSIYRGTSSGAESGTPVVTGITSVSYTDSSLTNGITYYYRITAVNSSGASGYSNEASATPIAGASLTGADIGSVGLAGSNSLNGGIYTVSGSGTDIFDNADALRYVYQQMTGDGSIIAQVTSETNTSVFAKAGVMMRNSLSASDPEASTLIHPAEPEEFDYRLTASAATGYSPAGTTDAAPYWVKLVRSGHAFSGYVSPDGSNWTLLGTETIAMNNTIYVGLAVCAHNNSALCTSTFANVQISSGGGGSVPATPTGLAATAGNAQISLAWSASTGATGYNIYRGLTASGESGTPIASGITSTGYNDTGTTNGTTYYYKVAATNSTGTSGYSNEANATPTAGGSGVAAVTANSFLNSISVCTHMTQGLDAESNVATCMTYAGIRNFRDDGSINSAALQNFINLHNATGAKACLLPPTANPADWPTQYDPVADAGALLAVEGTNEPNNEPPTFNGQTSSSTNALPTAQYQAALYSFAKSDSHLMGIPVFSSSEAGGSEPNNVGLQYLTIPTPLPAGVLMPAGTGYGDYANTHNYIIGNGITTPVDNTAWQAEDPTLNSNWDGLFGEYGTTWSKHFAGYSISQLPTLPRVTTETGWYTTAQPTQGQSYPISLDQQGKILLNLYLSAFKRGWSYTFVYYLHDSSQGYWGFFDPSYNSKPSGTYLHNLTTILADTTNFAPGSLNYSIPSEPATVHDLLIQRSNGTFYLAVWDDRPVGEGTDTVTVNLGGTYSVNEYDPTMGTTATNLGSVSSVTLSLSDHPVILQIP
jgi:regulation of enolase protein 1 (concanavalin A-like superfamily)